MSYKTVKVTNDLKLGLSRISGKCCVCELYDSMEYPCVRKPDYAKADYNNNNYYYFPGSSSSVSGALVR